MRIAASWRVVLPLVLLPCAATCYGATEIHLSLSTDACQRNPRVAIYAGADVASARAVPALATSSVACNESGGLGDLVFTPSGSADEHVVIVVLASFDGSDPTTCPPDGSAQCVVARRSARYSRHRSLELPVLLSERCLNVPCPSGPGDKPMTCVAGSCESAEVDDNPRLTDPAPPPSTPLDASSPGDASTPDGPNPTDAADAADSATDACVWGDGTHALPASRPVGSITSNTKDLYWVTAAGEIVRVPKNGTGALSTTNASLPSRILVDDTAIYLGATQPSPRLRRLAFGSVQSQFLLLDVRSLAQDAASVYVTTPSGVERVPKDVTWTANAIVSTSPRDVPQGIAVGGTTTYWLEATSVATTTFDGMVVSEPLTGVPLAIAADANGAVIALGPDPFGFGGGIVRYTAGPPTVLVDDPGITDAALAIDGSAVYFTRKLSTGSELRRLEAGNATVIDMPGALRGIVIDGPCLYYWAGVLGATTVGSIIKRPKQ